MSSNYPADHPRVLIPELCRQFYQWKWVTGTGGGIAMKHNGRYYLTPSGVHKERMKEDDLFEVIDQPVNPAEHQTDQSNNQSTNQSLIEGLMPNRNLSILTGPPIARRYTPSACTPLFYAAFDKRGAACCIHTHSQAAMMVTLINDKEFRITHQEMIKGIRIGQSSQSHNNFDEIVVPIIENTPHEDQLTESLTQALLDYPDANAVLVRRHGVYVWGDTWQRAKTMVECYDYLFEIALQMKQFGLDPAQTPSNSIYIDHPQRRTYPTKAINQ